MALVTYGRGREGERGMEREGEGGRWRERERERGREREGERGREREGVRGRERERDVVLCSQIAILFWLCLHAATGGRLCQSVGSYTSMD